MQRLYNERLHIGASAYDWRTRRASKWHPGSIHDSEMFCRGILDREFDNWGMFLRPEYYDDSLSELIVILHRLERKYDPSRTGSFERYARGILSRRSVDVGPRRVLGRNGTRIHDYVFNELEDAEGDGSGFSLTEESGDQVSLGGRDERWVQPEYARTRAWAIAVLGISAADGVEERAGTADGSRPAAHA